MNERIIELAEQADAGFPIGYPSGEGEDEEWQNLVVFKQKDLKKFAELIIKECAGIAKIKVLGMSTFENAEYVEEKIKEHFGVRE